MRLRSHSPQGYALNCQATVKERARFRTPPPPLTARPLQRGPRLSSTFCIERAPSCESSARETSFLPLGLFPPTTPLCRPVEPAPVLGQSQAPRHTLPLRSGPSPLTPCPQPTTLLRGPGDHTSHGHRTLAKVRGVLMIRPSNARRTCGSIFFKKPANTISSTFSRMSNSSVARSHSSRIECVMLLRWIEAISRDRARRKAPESRLLLTTSTTSASNVLAFDQTQLRQEWSLRQVRILQF